MTEKGRRLLIIEDDGPLRECYVDIAREAGYEVQGVGNLGDALNAINEVTYHVAVIDIQLSSVDEHNRDGLVILERLCVLEEGTESIILSGQPRIDVIVEAYEKFGITAYMRKGKVSTAVEITSAIDRAYERCKVDGLDSYSSLSAFLSGESDPSHWETRCMRVLQPLSGYSGLCTFFAELCASLTPLLPKKGNETPMQINEELACLSGDFWSKGLGLAISLLAFNKDTRRPEFDELARTGSEIRRFEKAGISGLIVAQPNANRGDFLDRLKR
jgi:ActR/RegA family two-component response regulator